MSILAIYTDSYPFGSAETFLESEIACLSSQFDEILIVPFYAKGKVRSIPKNVKVLSPIQKKKWPRFRVYLTGISCFYMIYTNPELKKETKKTSFIKRLKYLGFGILTKNKISERLPVESAIHYSYWLGFSAFALSLLKAEGKIQTIISRAHGFDVYEERGEKSLAFIKGATLKNLERIYFISNHGRNYLLTKFPEYSEKFCISRLGTSDPGFSNQIPERNSLTIVSCSAINQNKRINLILESLILLNSKFPSINIKWYHLGGGRDMQKYVEMADISFKDSQVKCFFPGQLTNTEIFSFYRSVPVDLFMNVSESEGIPVSIMEAQSCGIPVIATSAGGTPEIVNSENGFLLSANPPDEEISASIYEVYNNKEKWAKKRELSRKNWEMNFNAEKNYNSFAVDLLSLI